MKHNYKILLKFMVAGLMFSGCSKYLDVNTDPNRATDANITPELIFTQAEMAVGGRQASGDFLFLDHWVGYSGQNGTFAPQQNEITYNIDNNFADPIWTSHYNVLFDLYQAQVKALAENNDAIAGASMVLSAKLWQELVDLYNDIPYSQAFNVNQYPTPVFDKAQSVYTALQGKLDSAIVYLGNAAPKSFGAADIINHGNLGLWIKFANTMKLRLLVHQSQVSGFDPSAEITKIVNTGGPLGAGESISVNPGFVNDVNKQNTFYSNFGWTPTGVVATSSDNANDFIVTQLGADADPRLGRFFYPVGFSGNSFAGAKYGDDVGNIPTAAGLSYFGPGLVGGINSSNAGDGTGAVQNQWIMPSFESLFLVAEATARGWYPGVDSNAYKAAVTESFVWLGVPNADSAAAAYMVNNADANFTASAGATPTSKATFIVYQKYLSLTLIDPLEAYADIRRIPAAVPTGYISIAPGNSHTTLPLRLPYAQSEYTTNSTNALAEGTINIYSSKIFWEP
jgi:hypothetical protein